VRDLPAHFPRLRSHVLSNASHLAHLPPDKLERLTNERAKYLVGWSHGKETLRPGLVDRGKGSYYLNCGFYQDQHRDEGVHDPGQGDDDNDDARWAGFDEYTAPNRWPDEEDIPGFRAAAEELITLIIDVAVLVARACDRYALDAVEAYPERYLERMVKTSRIIKARLLHYFPAADGERDEAGTDQGPVRALNGSGSSSSSDNRMHANEDDWCATHLDHGCLTGLTSAMFLDESVTPSTSTSVAISTSTSPSTPNPSDALNELPRPPDPHAGLYIRSRDGSTVKVNIPRDCLAFQTGEALELITQGKFKAVPHFVRGVGAGGEGRIARNTLAVFTQPNLGEVVDHNTGLVFGEFARRVVTKNTASW
jgi:isopenicillin N synthase-like dioxygenase